MNRRELVAFLGGATAAWPLIVRAQPAERMRLIGVLVGLADDADTKTRVAGFLEGLQQSGWTDGRNVRIEYRWGAGNADNIRKHVAELVALAPDVIFATGSASTGPLIQATRTIPIVFAQVPDPVGAGFVENLARPGGNATGFVNFEYGISVKWLELLKEIAPNVKRAAVIRDPALAVGAGQFGAIQSAAAGLGIDVSAINLRHAGEIERSITEFSRLSNGGLILTGSALSIVHGKLIIALAAQHKLPAVYNDPIFTRAGGLIAYGPDSVDGYRRAASYVSRILKGEKPADLPVQLPTKYAMAINLKTAKALGLTVPPSLLARADEPIE